ncbi:hypothetical protein [Mycolicibacterium arabiense]|uniref:hypothetical protein n=1 Tax=Mycolicibacterium arabiense TaxID=1286181 RepID=UPI0027E27145|nr:hypothetical protein [Mycolicibacterium arabiense]
MVVTIHVHEVAHAVLRSPQIAQLGFQVCVREDAAGSVDPERVVTLDGEYVGVPSNRPERIDPGAGVHVDDGCVLAQLRHSLVEGALVGIEPRFNKSAGDVVDRGRHRHERFSSGLVSDYSGVADCRIRCGELRERAGRWVAGTFATAQGALGPGERRLMTRM